MKDGTDALSRTKVSGRARNARARIGARRAVGALRTRGGRQCTGEAKFAGLALHALVVARSLGTIVAGHSARKRGRLVARAVLADRAFHARAGRRSFKARRARRVGRGLGIRA